MCGDASTDDDCDGLVDPHDADADGDGVSICAGDCDDVRAARALEMMLALHLSHRSGGARVPLPLTDRDFGVDTV